jgi:hypothetical protein
MVASFWKSQWSLTTIAATKSPQGFNERSEELGDQAEVDTLHMLKRAQTRVGEVANAAKSLLDLSRRGGKGAESAQDDTANRLSSTDNLSLRSASHQLG